VRLDKYLKVSRIIKRRTIANEACSQGRVSINGKPAKPGTEVKLNDIIEIRFGENYRKYEILEVSEHAAKRDASAMFREL
jgi:ribosomal 50S subunit-recycling heat shock protein